MYYGDTTADKLLRRYRKLYSEDGSMEIVNDTHAGSTSFVFYLGGDAYSAPAIWKEEQTASAVAQNLYYLHRNHLGSILMITDAQGEVKEKRQFDAWGNIVKLTDGNGNPLTAFVILDRGYTGHEHLFGVALIHMNGRLYDPALHRFLSPDNFIQDPFNTQNFNRYGYVMNNPLSRVDKDGEFWQFLVGAAISVITNGISNLSHGQSFFHGAGKAALIGAIGGGASWGIGSIAGNIGNTIARTAFQTAAHGLLGGSMSAFGGGNFGSGFLSGAFGSLAAAGTGALLQNASSGIQAAGMIGSGALSGGIGSEISGGSFWDGVRNGAISAGLNHVAHIIQDKMILNSFAKQKFGSDYKEKYGVKSLKWGSQMGDDGDGATYNSKDQKIYYNGEATAGITTFDRRIYIANGIKAYGADFLEETIGHEFIHSYQHMTFGNSYNSTYSEYSAYQYSINFAISHNFAQPQINFFRLQQGGYTKSPSSNYNYNRIPGF